MMSHTQSPEVLAKQARIMADAGCQCVYVVDSAGAMVLEQVGDRVAALVAELGNARWLPWSREPRRRRREFGVGDPGGRPADRRFDPPLRRRCGNTRPRPSSGLRQAQGIKTGVDL